MKKELDRRGVEEEGRTGGKKKANIGFNSSLMKSFY